jgi:hypothetical protein
MVRNEIEELGRHRCDLGDTADYLKIDRLGELAGWTRRPCVSIYAPVDVRHVDATVILLKDLARSARQQLAEFAADSDRFAALPEFDVDLGGIDGHRGLATFAAPGFSAVFWLDVDLPVVAHVSDRFVVTPLVAALPATGRYHVLALSQHHVRLFRGHRAGLELVDVPNMPESVADALWYEDPERRVSWHGGAHVGAGRVGRIVHGSGSEHDVHADRLLRFFRAVDESISAIVHSSRARLLVAGVEQELAIYRRASRIPVVETISIGGTDRLSATELHDRCAASIRRLLDRPRRARLQHLARTARRAISLPDVLAACAASQVGVLFVRPDSLIWGSADGNGSDTSADRVVGDVELLSVAIGAAVRLGAKVFPAWPGELPDDAAIAASLRF